MPARTVQPGLTPTLSTELATASAALGYQGVLWFPDPDPVLRKAGRDLRVYRDLLSDPRVGPCCESRTGAVASLAWWLEPGQSAPQVVTALTQMLAAVDLDQMILSAAEAPLWGCVPLEVTWRQAPFAIGGGPARRLVSPAKVEAKPLEWFHFDVQGQLRFRSLQQPQGVPLPERKFLLARNAPIADNPYGTRVLSRCYWPVVIKRGNLQFWLTFLEKYGVPHIVGRLPRGTDHAEYDRLLEILVRMVQDAVAVIPDDAAVELLTVSQSGGQQLFSGLKQECDNDITIAVCGQNLTTEVAAGSYAAAQTHFAVRADLRDRDKKIVQRTVQQLVDWICQFNDFPRPWPRFTAYQEQDVDLATAQRDRELHAQGLRFTPHYYRRTYGFEADDLAGVVEPLAGPAPGANYSEPPGSPGQGGPDPLQQLLSTLGPETLQAQAEALLQPVLATLARDLAAGLPLERVAERLLTLAPELDGQALETQLTRVLWLAETLGRLTAAGGTP